MARSKKGGFTPAERTLRFRVEHRAGFAQEQSHVLDLSRELSKINRRLYRQHKAYQVANITVSSRDTVNGNITFSTAPDTWVTRGALRRGKQMFDKMQKKVLDAGGVKSRYNDYKVYLSTDHKALSAINTPGVVDNENVPYGDGEWIYSRFVRPDDTDNGDEFVTHILGAHDVTGSNYASVGLVLSYGESRASVNTVQPLTDQDSEDDPLVLLFNDSEVVDDIFDDMKSNGAQPPYAQTTGGALNTIGENYPGSSTNAPNPVVKRMATIGSTAGESAPSVMLPGFTALCGLIEIETQSGDTAIDDTFDVVIELAPGNYKGVAAFDI